jgi:hypothetical protein
MKAALTVLAGASMLTAAAVLLAQRAVPDSTASGAPPTPPPGPVASSPASTLSTQEPYVAFSSAFAAFRAWERIPVEGAMLPVGAAPGPTAIYVNARAPAGATRWPVGTILVKTVEHAAPEDWVIHAMVKRGVPYNRDGALGWEFFELRFEAGSDAPHVVWRGTGPPSGHGYAAQGRDAGAVALVCNDCHAAAWQSDGALTPALAFARP